MGLRNVVRGRRDSGTVEPDVSRRRFLTRGAITAAVAAAGSAALADTASANDGNNVVIGAANTNTLGSSNSTQLSGTTTGGIALFEVLQGSNFPQSHAINGVHSGTAGTGSAVGVHGETTNSTGGIGVEGFTSGTGGGIGVLGFAGNAVGAAGLKGIANAGAGLLLGTNDHHSMPPTTDLWDQGSFVVSLGHVWYCYAGGVGTESSWVKLSSTLITLPAPVRVYDSRPGANPAGIGPKTQLAVGEDRQLDMTVNSSGVPATASTVLLNLAVTGTGPSGFLGLFKDGISYPNNANINWSFPGQNLSNAVTSAVANAGKLRVHCGGSPTDIVIDVIGYYL
jgi:hypothetical protein